jgi:prevent-host-death family protein
MGRVGATEFKARCLELMDRVAERSESYVITKRGKPVAQLVPVGERPPGTILGALRGLASTSGDIVAPVLALSDWETLQEWDEVNGTRAPRGKPRRKASRPRR